jgi:dipeptidyl aminopeptidase/acylaminoacyl peptidase
MILPLRDVRAARPRVLPTPAHRSVSELAWSPDGSRLALAMEGDRLRFIVGREPRGDEEPVARRINRIDWRADDTGHVDRRSQVFLADAARQARPIALTDADWDVSGLAWSPDGSRIAFAADPRADADLRPRRSIWTVPAAMHAAGVSQGATAPIAQATEVLALPGDAHSPAWSPDGRWLAAIGMAEPEALDDLSPTLVIGRADGSGTPRAVAPELDRPLGAWVDTDLHGWTASQRSTPCWLDDSSIVALVSDRGRTAPWRFDVASPSGASGRGPGMSGPGPAAAASRAVASPAVAEPLVAGDIAAMSLATAPATGRGGAAIVTMLACIGSQPVELITLRHHAHPPEGAATLQQAQSLGRTRLGGTWADRLPWPEMRSIDVPGPGGPIETWIASPAGAADRPLPTIVDIHGGPLGAWAPAPSIEVVLLCARGYRVVLPNIRGSATYGRAWIRPQLGDWGGVDAADVHAAIDRVIELGLADPGQLGALGLSYGGFMVNWLVGTSQRFRAAVSENGVTNQVGAWANSDSGVEYNRSSLLGAPLDPDGVARLWRQSPLAHVSSISTPLLLLQAEADRRCPAADNEQLFIALRVLGQTVEYVLYPEEFHVYQAAGRPDRRIDRMTRMLDWFDRYVRA